MVTRTLVPLGSALFAAIALPAMQPAPPEPAATIRTSAAEVMLDVVVRDKRGKPVRNLKANDLEIYENGLRQQVRGFRLVSRRRAEAQPAVGAGRPAPAEAPALPLRAVNLLCIVFHNLDPVSRTRAVRALDEMLQDELPPGLFGGVFTLDDHLSPVAPFTGQREELKRAVAEAFSGGSVDFDLASEAILTANPNQATVTALVDLAGRTADVNMRVTGGEISKAAVTSADVSTGTGANALRGDRARERVDFANINGLRAIDQMRTMISRLSTLPGKKSVLLFSTGLLTTGDPDEYEAVISKATGGGVTIYTIDPTELNETTDLQAANIALSQVAAVSRAQTQIDSSGGAGAARTRSRQGDSLDVAVRSSDPRAALRAISEGTGGFLVANTSEFRKPFLKILDEIETRYEVTYRPAALKFDGRLRNVEVKTSRPNLLVESRTGYFALPGVQGQAALKPYEVVALAALGRQAPPSPFEFQTALFSFGRNGAARRVALAFEIPGAGLTAAPDTASSTGSVHPSLLALVKDSVGDVVDKYSLDAPLTVPLANLDALRAGSVTYAHSLSLAPGHYSAETAILDRQGGRVSVKTVEFEVAPLPAGLAMSTPVLVQRVEPAPGASGSADPLLYQGQRVIPMVSTLLPPSASPYVYLVIYPDPSRPAAPSLQIDFLVNGQVLASQNSQLPAPDASGSIPMLIAAGLRPGLCTLRLTATQDGATARGSVRYVAAAKP